MFFKNIEMKTYWNDQGQTGLTCQIQDLDDEIEITL